MNWINLFALIAFMATTLLFQNSVHYAIACLFILLVILGVRLAAMEKPPFDPNAFFFLSATTDDKRRVSQRAALLFPLFLATKTLLVLQPVLYILKSPFEEHVNARTYLMEHREWLVLFFVFLIPCMVLQHGYWDDLHDLYRNRKATK
ncbi:hypothetical protein [Deinococcus roseus]|uniref:Uncharacterized protein n=1 Tax=Deinococcus roseus TaxID=392414 RepID=A0ABQ2D3D4_9DEIO|nr:hypothetical protein [Deinococcus roseus]GGJ44592.1 hypothetical protein GCM10008938_33470 [Deinococcus roseus]